MDPLQNRFLLRFSFSKQQPYLLQKLKKHRKQNQECSCEIRENIPFFCSVSYKKQETKTAQNSGTLIDFSTWVSSEN